MSGQRFTAADKHACADRELRMRERIYPRWIENGKMTKQKADQEIAMMSEIAADYAKLAEGERLI